ncbi:FHA domain-containing protein [Paraburkholderia youngii]|uniref:FHA domain-containing protein n=1 Tax=Paraburkholderia youngii TaxID=2782701 RepID=UPI003D23E42E
MNYPILSLRVARFNDETLAEPIVIAFGPAGGTIGRANDCTLVLPDQQRAISRVHARVEFRGGDYLLCDLGSNPSVLNQRALGGTREARLADGDRLVIGPYLLEVSIGEQAASVRGLTGGHDPLSAAQVLSGPLAADSQGDVLQIGALDPLGQPGFGAPQRISSRPGFAGSESDHVSPELQAFSAPPASGPGPSPAGRPRPRGASLRTTIRSRMRWRSGKRPGSRAAGRLPHRVLRTSCRDGPLRPRRRPRLWVARLACRRDCSIPARRGRSRHRSMICSGYRPRRPRRRPSSRHRPLWRRWCR